MLGIGLIAGAVIGAGIALLAAPRTGEEMRDKIRDRVRHIRGKDDAWGKLKRELKRAAKVRRRSDVEKRREREEKMLARERAERDAKTTELGT
jgi:gas vesicle protein